MPQPKAIQQKCGHGRSERALALALIACVGLVAFWEFMANRSRRPLQPFQLTAEDFAGFAPRSEVWNIRAAPVSKSPIEPTILIYEMMRKTIEPVMALTRPVPISVRLVHGYNMPDCMRIRRYEVELVQDTRTPAGVVPNRRQLQVWRMKSPSQDVSLSVTTMLLAGDLSETSVDTRSMPFPRIGIPDDPNWVPRGFTLDMLKHPVRNFLLLMRSRWNSARCDLATFLRLRQPAWACEDLLTLVAMSHGPSVAPEEEAAVIEELIAAQTVILRELQSWRKKSISESEQRSAVR